MSEKSLSLYNEPNQFIELMDKVEDKTIEPEEDDKLWNELRLELQKKSTSVIGYVKDRIALIDAIDIEIKKLQEYKKREQNKVDRFKEIVKQNMNVLKIKKIETPLGTLTVAQSPISVEITNEDKIPDGFKEKVITTNVDKKAIVDYFKTTGEIVDGVMIYTKNTNLRIK